MRTITALDAKNRFGQLLDAARRGPVTVTKKGRPAAVLLSVEDYARIRGAARRRLLATVARAQAEAAGLRPTPAASPGGLPDNRNWNNRDRDNQDRGEAGRDHES